MTIKEIILLHKVGMERVEQTSAQLVNMFRTI